VKSQSKTQNIESERV